MADTLNLEQISEFRQAFLLFDRDSKGIIKAKELGSVMKALGQDLSKKQLENMIDEIDGDGNRSIDFPEFLVMLAREYNRKQIERDIKSAFSKQELIDINKAFQVFDKDNQYAIKCEDLPSFLKLLNVELNNEELVDTINELNNGKGQIEFTQVLIILARRFEKMSSEDDLKQAFKFFDSNNDGLISMLDLKQSMDILGERFSDEEIEEMIREADSNKDGFLNEREFIAIMRPETRFLNLDLN